MKKKKTLLFIGGILLAVLAVSVFIYFNSANTPQVLSLEELLPYNENALFAMASVSRRGGEQGTVTDLFETTSEKLPSLSEDCLKLLSVYSYREVNERVPAGEFISLSFAYSEERVTRIELYANGYLLLFTENGAGIYQAFGPDSNTPSPYKALYSYFTGESI